MVSNLTTMLASSSFQRAFLLASAVAYGMYVVALVFELRLPGSGPNDVPVWRDQSRAYMPGDFGLALLVATGWYLRPAVTDTWANSTWFMVGSVVVGGLIFGLARWKLYTQRDYSIAAWRSPSKRYHDVVMFWAFSAIAIYICLPAYVFAPWSQNILVKLLGLFGLAVWVVGNYYDFTHNETPNTRQHPTIYRPIWRD